MRGSVSLVGEVILILVVVSVLIPFVYFVFVSSQEASSAQAVALNRFLRKAYKSVDANWTGSRLIISNRGGTEETITYVGVKNGSKTVLISLSEIGGENINFTGGAQLRNNLLVLPPGSSAEITLPEKDLTPVYVVTYDGVIIPVEYMGTGGIAEAARALILKTIVFQASDLNTLIKNGQLSINDPKLITDPTLENISNGNCIGMRKVIAYDSDLNYLVCPLMLYKEYNGENGVELDIDAHIYGLVMIGYSPQWLKEREGPPRYNIYIRAVKINNDDHFYIDNENLVDVLNYPINYPSYHYRKYGGFVIKIEDYEPYDEDNAFYIESWYYNITTSQYSYEKFSGSNITGRYFYGGFNPLTWRWSLNDESSLIHLVVKGVAKNIKIYKVDDSKCAWTDSGSTIYDTSYEPYIFIADIDENGIPELYYVTLDAEFDHADYTGDYWPSYYGVVDYSDKPLFMLFDSMKVEGGKYASVDVNIRLYFHDNLGDDVDEVENSDRRLFGIYLWDLDEGRVVSGAEWTYQQLAPLEDTYPPNQNFVSFHTQLIVPDNNHTYVVAIRFWDPYATEYGNDDGEFVIGVEFVGMTFYVREQG